MSDATDRNRVRRSALRVGLWVGVASALVIAAGVAILVVVVLLTARSEHGPEGRGDPDHVVVDVDRVLPVVLLLGVVGVVLLAVIGWLAARWTVRPLAEALRVQRNFVSDASHELRTPLTALNSRIQILQRRHDRGEPIQETISELRQDAARMDELLTDMLMSAEAGTADRGAADVAECVAAAAATLRPVADDSGVGLLRTASAGMIAAMPAVTLTRLLVALIDNAVQHAPAGSDVTIDARAIRGVVELRISDRGPGVRPEDAARIFERFARAGETGRRRGFGLGLALVRETVTRFGGAVTIERTSPAGTTFLVTIPAA